MSIELTGLDGKVALVTGAGRMRGIGRAIALELARAGCDVVVTGTGRPATTPLADEQQAGWRDAESVADEIRALGRRAEARVCDISDPHAVEALVADVVETFGRADILVNNAAASKGSDRVPVTELPVDLWDRIIAINLNGTFYLSRAFAQHLLAQGSGGSIVNISSIAGKQMPGNVAAYGASKAAIHALTSSMAQELGPDGIRVNAICPGMTDTSRLDDIPRNGPWQETIDANIPLRRAGAPQDVGWATAFLCSDQGAYVTGQAWNVDGGYLTIR